MKSLNVKQLMDDFTDANATIEDVFGIGRWYLQTTNNKTEVTKFDLDTDGYEEFGMELFDRKVKNFFNDKFYFDLGPPDNTSTYADLLKKGFILGKFKKSL